MNEDIKLTKAQQMLFDVILEAAENNDKIHDMLYCGCMTGKSFIFRFMDEYFENTERQEARSPQQLPPQFIKRIKDNL